jgi:transposase
MQYYIGLDVSQRNTAISVVDYKGKVVDEGKTLTLPSDIFGWLIKVAVDVAPIKAVCIEAGAMSSWLYKELSKLGLPMVCVEAYQAHAFLKTQRNKTDKNDARGLAQLVRVGGDYIKPVIIRDTINQEDRVLLTLRQSYVTQKVALENSIAGIMKPFGIVIARKTRSVAAYNERVTEALAKNTAIGSDLREAVFISLDAYVNICASLEKLTKQIRSIAMANPICRRMMTVPGVGPIVALSFVTAIDTPGRFRKAEDVGAYLGLTTKKFESGETSFSQGISRRGSTMTRLHLVQAATVLLSRSSRWSSLRAWGMQIAKRRGFGRARIAVARKLAVIMHRMWITEQDFRWSNGIELPKRADATTA